MDIKTFREDGLLLFYDPSFKRKVCLEYLTKGISIYRLRKKYNIRGTSTIQRWVGNYHKEQQMLTLDNMITDPKDTSDSGSAQEDHSLREKLKQAELKVIALETMIDLAEEHFDIEIRKKSGTKPSGK